MMAEKQGLITTKQGRVSVGGCELDIVCSHFGSRVFLLVSQLHKIGTLLEVCRDPVAVPGSTHTFSVRTLLGKDEPLVHVFGRAIAAHLPLPPHTPLLLALGLREHPPHLLPPLLKELEQFTLWDT